MTIVTVDFIAFDDDRDACLLVLVEEGWNDPIEANLRSLQERLYGCLNAALDGKVADLYPQSIGRIFVIQVDCYDPPSQEITEFFDRFATGIGEMSDYSTENSPFVREFQFEISYQNLE